MGLPPRKPRPCAPQCSPSAPRPARLQLLKTKPGGGRLPAMIIRAENGAMRRGNSPPALLIYGLPGPAASRPDCARAAEKQGPKWLAPGGYSPWSASGSNVSNLTWKTTPLSPVNRCAGLVLRNRAMDQDPGQRVVYPGAGLELTNLGKLAFLKAR